MFLNSDITEDITVRSVCDGTTASAILKDSLQQVSNGNLRKNGSLYLSSLLGCDDISHQAGEAMCVSGELV